MSEFSDECKTISQKFQQIDESELEKSKRIRKCLRNIKKLCRQKMEPKNELHL